MVHNKQVPLILEDHFLTLQMQSYTWGQGMLVFICKDKRWDAHSMGSTCIDTLKTNSPRHNHCWQSLTSTLYLQLMNNIMVKGLLMHSYRVYSDKFHELCCSHLFCRIIDISPHKSISNDKTDHTIVKVLSRRLKQTYHLLYLESRRESPRWIRLGIL
jgi:hypothetical protein